MGQEREPWILGVVPLVMTLLWVSPTKAVALPRPVEAVEGGKIGSLGGCRQIQSVPATLWSDRNPPGNALPCRCRGGSQPLPSLSPPLLPV
jgi:hypothetical protein